MKEPFSPFFPFEMQVKTPSRPRLRHQLIQLYKRKVFAPFYIFLLEPYVGTLCQHKFGVMFEGNIVSDEGTFLFLSFCFFLVKCR